MFTGLHAGEYLVEVTSPGYQPAQAQAIIAANGETEYIEIEMMHEGVASAGRPGGVVLAPRALRELEKGLQALQANRLDEAELHLKKAQHAAPGYPDVSYLLGVLYLQRHNAGQARDYLEKAVKLAPKHAPALLALGEAEFLQRDYPHAVESLELSASVKPTAWRAYWLAAAAYYQQGEYAKSRERAEEAVRIGQEKAGNARLLLGEAQAALSEWDAALATLEQFLRDDPNNPLTATTQKLMQAIRERREAKAGAVAISTNPAPRGAGTFEPFSLSGAAIGLVTPVTETSWAPPDVDEEKPTVEAGSSCAADEVAATAGERTEELVKNVDRFTATEEMEHESLSPLGLRMSRETRTFQYLVEIRKTGTRQFNVEEYRDGSISLQGFPAHLGTIGLPVLALVFHPYYRHEYEFRCEGRGAWRGKPTWVLHFRQRDDQASEMRRYHVNGMSFPVRLKGRAWIDVDTAQVLAIEADMIRPVPEIRLVRDHQLIEYGPVEFRKAGSSLWLPKSADWYCNLAGQRYHRRHGFRNFLLFSIDDSQKIGKPAQEKQ